MKISSKLFISFLIIVILGVISGYVGYRSSNATAQKFNIIANEMAPSVLLLEEISSLFNRMQVEALSVALLMAEANQLEGIEHDDQAGDGVEKNNHEDEGSEEEEDPLEEAKEEAEEFELSNQNLHTAIKKLSSFVEPQVIVGLRRLQGAVYTIATALIEVSMEGKNAHEVLELKEKLEDIEEEVEAILSLHTAKEFIKLDEQSKEANETSTHSRIFVLSISILSIFVSLVLGYLLWRGISLPISKLKETVFEFGKGNFGSIHRFALKMKLVI